MDAMTAPTLTLPVTGPDTEDIIRHGWQVWNRLSGIELPAVAQKHATDLWTALEKYGRLLEDHNWSDLAGLAAGYARQVSDACDRIEELTSVRGEAAA